MSRIKAPEFPPRYPWLNCKQPLSLKDLKGRVVLLDFWTYCCINCLHVLPDLKSLEQQYQSALTVIGVHSAKFDHEKEIESIRQAILRYDIEHPVLIDSGFRVWQQYVVRAWPTLIVVDPEGYIAGRFAGEGRLPEIEELMSTLIRRESGTPGIAPALDSEKLGEKLDEKLGLEKRRHPVEHPLAFPGKVLAVGDRLFIADSGHHRIVLTSLEGQVLQVIGSGKAGGQDGSFSEAQFSAPQGMALEAERLYVADTGNHTIRCVDLERQTVETIAGTAQQNRIHYPHSGIALQTALNSPWDLEQVGNFLMIAMAGSHQIWAIDLQDGLLGTYAGTGAEACVDGLLETAAFAQPSGITTDAAAQELYVADSESSTIRAVSLEAQPTVRTVCGSGDLFGFGDVDGQGEAARFQHCLGVAKGKENDLWIADTYNHKIKRVNVQTGDCVTLLGSGQPGLRDGEGTAAQFYEPSGLSLTGSRLYVADTNNHAIRQIDLDSLRVTTLKFPGLCAPDLCFPELVENINKPEGGLQN